MVLQIKPICQMLPQRLHPKPLCGVVSGSKIVNPKLTCQVGGLL
jgi:hypothetical protein